MSGTFSREAAVLRAKRILEMARDGDEAGMAHAISTGEAFSTVDFHGRPPLMIAAKYGNSGCVGLLLASLGEGEARKADGSRSKPTAGRWPARTASRTKRSTLLRKFANIASRCASGRPSSMTQHNTCTANPVSGLES